MKKIDMDISISIEGIESEALEEFSQVIDESAESIISGDVDEVFLGTIWFEIDDEYEEESQELIQREMTCMDDKDYLLCLIEQGNCSPSEEKICRWLLEKNQGRRLVAFNFIFEVLEW